MQRFAVTWTPQGLTLMYSISANATTESGFSNSVYKCLREIETIFENTKAYTVNKWLRWLDGVKLSLGYSFNVLNILTNAYAIII